MATLLSICRDAMDRANLGRPTQVISGTDQTTRTLLGCAQRQGSNLARRWAWQALVREQTFVSNATAIQSGSIPTDWDNRMVSDTFYNRTQRRPVVGPLSSQQWQSLQSINTQIATDAYRIRNNLIELTPVPTAGRTYAYEYISKNWCTSSGGTGQSAWATDTDLPVLDAELMTMGVQWRFLMAMGMDYAGTQSDYETEVSTVIGRDGSRALVRLGGEVDYGVNTRLLNQEGSWVL